MIGKITKTDLNKAVYFYFMPELLKAIYKFNYFKPAHNVWKENYTLLNGDCLKMMKTLPDNSIDSIVTDPPYELGFMGKKWDSTGIAFNQKVWEECLRVLKPGGHLLAFSGTRTYHRMVVAIEDAGFEVRDQIQWVYGSGFPKSLDVSKGIDKRGGQSVSWFGEWLKKYRIENKIKQSDIAKLFPSKTGGKTGCVANWELGFNLPTTEQFNLICKTFNLPFASLEEAERAVIGNHKTDMGGLGGERLGESGGSITAPATDAAKQWEGWGTALKPANEPICVARKPLKGTVADNVLKHGTGAINIDGCRVLNPDEEARWPANFIHDGSAEVNELLGKSARFFYTAKASRKDRDEGLDGFEKKGNVFNGQNAKSTIDGFKAGSVEDKFTTTPKANNHPTVKPTDLMAYLVRLVTPPKGTVLDPFNGSGSTGKACMREGFKYVGIDLSDEYLKISQARIDHELSKVKPKN